MNILVVISAAHYEGWTEWAKCMFHCVGLQGMMTLDARHGFFYSSGRRTA